MPTFAARPSNQKKPEPSCFNYRSLFVLLAFGFLTIPIVALSNDLPFKLYVIAGQSNAGGVLDDEDPDRSDVGVEYSMRSYLISRRNENFHIFKYFKSNSNLHTDWDPFANPIEEASSQNGWKLYKDFIEKLNQRVTELAAIHSNISLEGFVWIQGESDRGADAANEYGTNLRKLIDNIRADLNAPTLKFYITELSSSPLRVGTQKIRQHQWNIAKGKLESRLWTILPAPHIEFIHTSDLSFFDGVHFDRASYDELGNRLASTIVRAERQNTTTLKRHELTQYYDRANKQHFATSELPGNAIATEYYEYRTVLGRLYTFNAANDTRVPLFSCRTGNSDNKFIPRTNSCDYNNGEAQTLLGWINSTPSNSRLALYKCYAPSIKSTVLMRSYNNCPQPVVSPTTVLEENPDFLGYIEKNR